MRILAINGGLSGSSGSIMNCILKHCLKNGDIVYTATPVKQSSYLGVNNYCFVNQKTRLINNFLTKLNGSDGFRNKKDTKRLIEFIKSFKPDIVHLHTIHGYFVNLEILIKYLYKHQIPIVITLHDCFYFTGRCSHYFASNCYKWVSGCHNCKNKRIYPGCFLFDRVNKFYKRKMNTLSNKNIYFVAVSKWLQQEALKSAILKNEKVTCIYNGINHDIFKIGTNILNEQKRIICVANPWSKEKGLNILYQLLDNEIITNAYFTIVGEGFDFKTNNKNIKYIKNVSSPFEMAELYRQNDIYLNISMQETFSLTNIEAQACGNSVIAYPTTGISETLCKETSYMVNDYTFDAFRKTIMTSLSDRIDKKKNSNFAKSFSKEKMCNNYYQLYLRVCYESKHN